MSCLRIVHRKINNQYNSKQITKLLFLLFCEQNIFPGSSKQFCRLRPGKHLVRKIGRSCKMCRWHWLSILFLIYFISIFILQTRTSITLLNLFACFFPSGAWEKAVFIHNAFFWRGPPLIKYWLQPAIIFLSLLSFLCLFLRSFPLSSLSVSLSLHSFFCAQLCVYQFFTVSPFLFPNTFIIIYLPPLSSLYLISLFSLSPILCLNVLSNLLYYTV